LPSHAPPPALLTRPALLRPGCGRGAPNRKRGTKVVRRPPRCVRKARGASSGLPSRRGYESRSWQGISTLRTTQREPPATTERARRGPWPGVPARDRGRSL
jgi:hypothetical protein